MIKTIKMAGRELHPIGIGTWGIGGFMETETGNEDQQIAMIQYSVEKGQNHIDIAEMYGNGPAEETTGQAIKKFDRSQLFIASKVHRNYGNSKDVVKAVEKILKRLQIDFIDMLYIHSYWEEENMDEWLSNANLAVDKGLAKSLAVSNWTVENLKWGISKSKNKIVANQMNYNILHQVEIPQEMKNLCAKEGITLVAYRPVERGLLADQCENQVVLDTAEKYEKTPVQIALNWLLAQNIIPIPKSSNKSHIDENLGALDFDLADGDIKLLNSINV